MIQRNLTKVLKKAAEQWPIVAVTGPRQSGKTTLYREIFPSWEYVNLEYPDVRRFAAIDPRGFLKQFSEPVILDEVQRVPQLFSYLMPLVDETHAPGQFMLSGSQNFLLLDSISQSLAGRCATFNLLPLSNAELNDRLCPSSLELDHVPWRTSPKFELEELLFRGAYPALYSNMEHVSPSLWYAQYVQSYLERDVRSIVNIGDIETFERFLGLCAGRSAQVLNMSSLANDTGVSVPTVKRWLSILQTSFVITLLPPYEKNFNKRLTRSPKLYFLDTGLLCYLLHISEADELLVSSFRTAVFETFVVSELFKSSYNAGLRPPLYFWHVSGEKEVDVVIDRGSHLPIPIEIKSGRTANPAMARYIDEWIAHGKAKSGLVIYGGNEYFSLGKVEFVSWSGL
ncbi:MAG: ATP-binding protein [Sphaerochaetaceae bacterium]